MSKVFVIDRCDNVATALDDIAEHQDITILGESSLQSLRALEGIRSGHKIALTEIPRGEEVLKYGRAIGIASADIEKGAWVHLHNCESRYDERSNTLDCETGEPTDMDYV